ncbi:unnamed protein product [Protopolystoma xenopodis]|uniref:Uncharacterized protein n=1 Tax=Protopolystoma xenopodis TaxID=117903 RepID=A0A3S5FCW2_9PLAT|nr:unnamed protein product [Protopolystoma xenopodis]
MVSCSVRLTEDVGEMSGNVPNSRFDSGNDYAYYRLRTRYVSLGLTVNMIRSRKRPNCFNTTKGDPDRTKGYTILVFIPGL